MSDFKITDKSGIKLKTANTYVTEDLGVTLTDNDINNIVPENIAKNITILGVVGTFEGNPKPEQTKTVEFNPGSANNITITPDTGYVLSSVQVNKPATMIPSNIKSGVNIGGVVGTYEASGGGYPTFATVLQVNTFEVYSGEVLLEYLINNDEVKNGWQTIDAIGTIEVPDVYVIKFRIHATDNTGRSNLILSINNGTSDLVNIMHPAVGDVTLETVNFAILEDTTLTIDVNLS